MRRMRRRSRRKADTNLLTANRLASY